MSVIYNSLRTQTPMAQDTAALLFKFENDSISSGQQLLLN